MQIKKNIISAYLDAAPISSVSEETDIKDLLMLLNSNGCNVIQTVLASDISFWSHHNQQSYASFFELKSKEIKKSDIFVCVLNKLTPILVGEIVESISLGKPTLIITNLPMEHMQKEFVIRNCLVHLHPKTEDLGQIVSEFVDNAKRKLPKGRFSVRLSEDLDKKLNDLKKEYGVDSKNDVILKLIEQA